MTSAANQSSVNSSVSGVVLVLALMSVANIVDFPECERNAPWVAVFSTFENAAAADLGRAHPSLSRVATPYLMLRQSAPGSTISFPSSHCFLISCFYGLGSADGVRIHDYNRDRPPIDLSTLPVLDETVDDGLDGKSHRYCLLAADSDVSELFAFEQQGNWYFTDVRLLPDNFVESARK